MALRRIIDSFWCQFECTAIIQNLNVYACLAFVTNALELRNHIGHWKLQLVFAPSSNHTVSGNLPFYVVILIDKSIE